MKTIFLAAAVLAAPLPVFAAGPELDAARLDAVFSGKTALVAGALPEISAAPVAVKASISAPLPPNPAMDPAGFAAWQKALLDEIGVEPNKKNSASIESAMSFVRTTACGKELCTSLTGRWDCDERSLKAAGVEIRLADLPDNKPADMIHVAGTKRVITLDIDMVKDGTHYKRGDVAAVLIHEMSHAEDAAKYTSQLKEARLATEMKAYASMLQAYTEILHYDKGNGTDSLTVKNNPMYAFVQAWRYKFEGGPLPDTFTYKGLPMTGREFVDAYLGGGDSPFGFVMGMTKFYYKDLSLITNDPANFNITLGLRRDVIHRAIKYGEFREESGMDQSSYYDPPPPPVQPPQPVHPVQPPQNTQPAQPIQPAHPVQPAQPVEPAQPPQNTQPVQPPHQVDPPPPPPGHDDDDTGGGNGGGQEVPGWAIDQANNWINGNNSTGW